MKEKLRLLLRRPALIAAPAAGCVCGILLLGLPGGGVTAGTAPAAILAVIAAALVSFALSLALGGPPAADGGRGAARDRAASGPASKTVAAERVTGGPAPAAPFPDSPFAGGGSVPDWFLEDTEEDDPDALLERRNIVLNCPSVSAEEAIRACGRLLVDAGYVEEPYIEGMLEREKEFPLAIGNHVAIPHGVNAARRYIRRSGIVVMTYPGGIDWDGDIVKLVIGIAAQADEHLDILGRIVSAASTEEDTDRMVEGADANAIYNKFNATEY